MRADPHSTPARRRRIIAEMAKKMLKGYCVTACENVCRFRIQTKAAIVMQCSFRVYFSKKYLARLLFVKKDNGAIKIQAIWRMRSAVIRREQLARELRLRQAEMLSLMVANLWNSRKQRLFKIAMLVALNIAKEKKILAASITIQRIYRGHLGRLKAKCSRNIYYAYLNRRVKSAVLIQSMARKCLSIKLVDCLRRRRQAGNLINKVALSWWKVRALKIREGAVIIQKYYRRYFAINLLQRVRAAARKKVLDAAQERNETADHVVKSMHIHVDLDISLLKRMAILGPSSVIRWSLNNAILKFRSMEGYSVGPVIQQVMRTVEQATSITETEVSPSSIDDDDVDENRVIKSTENYATTLPKVQHNNDNNEKVISLLKWDEANEVNDDPGSDNATLLLPKSWGDKVIQQQQEVSVNKAAEHYFTNNNNNTNVINLYNNRMLINIDNETKNNGSHPNYDTVGAGVTVKLLHDNIVIQIEYDCFQAEDGDVCNDSSNSNNHYNLLHVRNNIIISLNIPSNNNVTNDKSIQQYNLIALADDSAATTIEEGKDYPTTADTSTVALNDLKFRFKNALVFVKNSSSSEYDKEGTTATIHRDEGEGNITGGGRGGTIHSCITNDTSSSSSSVVRILLKEDEETSDDHSDGIEHDNSAVFHCMEACRIDMAARCIQKYLRNQMLRRRAAAAIIAATTAAARKIQYFYRKYSLLYRWHAAVYATLGLAQSAAVYIQCCIRSVLARKYLAKLRQIAAESFEWGHDFQVDEAANWAAFGIPISNSVTSISNNDVSNIKINNNNNNNKNYDNFKEKIYRHPAVKIPNKIILAVAASNNNVAIPNHVIHHNSVAMGNLLHILKYPFAPPPGCLLPVGYSINNNNSGSYNSSNYNNIIVEGNFENTLACNEEEYALMTMPLNYDDDDIHTLTAAAATIPPPLTCASFTTNMVTTENTKEHSNINNNSSLHSLASIKQDDTIADDNNDTTNEIPLPVPICPAYVASIRNRAVRQHFFHCTDNLNCTSSASEHDINNNNNNYHLYHCDHIGDIELNINDFIDKNCSTRKNNDSKSSTLIDEIKKSFVKSDYQHMPNMLLPPIYELLTKKF